MAIIYGRSESEKELLDKYPDRVETIEDIPRVHKEMIEELKVPQKGFFGGIKRWNKQRQVNKFEKNKDNPFHAGARGELNVLDRLSELPDDYHVLCGVNIALPYWVTYNGKKNLRSAQMDYVITSHKGVYMIEVKNWSRAYANRHDGLSPYEQTDRAGRVLWIFLKSWRFSPRVTNVLLSTSGSFEYNRNYKAVFVSSLDRINQFIQNRRDELSENDVKKVVKKLKGHVTY